MNLLPVLSFPSTWPDDEHAFCPDCTALMCRDNRGLLVCPDCKVAALDAAEVRS